MSKRYTKIICTALAAVSAVTLAVMPACSGNWGGVSGDKDNSTTVTSNGGFLVETGDEANGYVYFINGKASNTDSNKFGSVVKGSVQRIKKTDIAAQNYSSTQTVVPSVFYSGNYNAGLYIYDGYIYYATPSTAKNAEGEVLNSNLEFKRTKLDGTDTTKGYIWQCSDNAVDYRYVQPTEGGDVYIIYALSEKLYGTDATNIHAVNCRTKKNTILAYNVSSYAFDTVDATNPYIYYTMNVPYYLGESGNYGYNQLYRVRADVTESPREYDFKDIDGYNSSTNPLYINLGDYVFDGIGWVNYNSGRVSQLNYAYGKTETYTFNHSDYTFAIRSYKDGVLYYTRKSEGNTASLFTLTNDQIDADNNGKVDETWNAMAQTFTDGQKPLIAGADTTEYEFVEMDGKLWAVNAGSSGLTKCEVLVEQQKLDSDNTLTMTDASSATILEIKEEWEGENKHTNLYYSVTGGSGYTINRIAIDGSFDDYKKLPYDSEEPDLTYRGVKVLDLDASSSWFKPEFVGNKLFFASVTAGMTDYNYIMVCDLTGENGIMTNNEIDKLNDKFDGVKEEIAAFDKEENADGSAAYDGLSNALTYLFYTGDVNYIDELRQALVDVEGRDIEYAYSNDSVKLYKDFATADGVWSDETDPNYKGTNYKEGAKTINGKTVYSNSRDYYYTVVGKVKESDRKKITDYFKNRYMKSYPVDDSTWWTDLTSAEQGGFIFGMTACGLIVAGGIICLVAYLVALKKGSSEERERTIKVDITDDKSLDVYGDEEGGETSDNS